MAQDSNRTRQNIKVTLILFIKLITDEFRSDQ